MKKKTTYPVDQSSFFKVVGLGKLSSALDVGVDFVRDLADVAGSLYDQWEETDGTKTRRIENPHHSLKQVQARITRLMQRIRAPSYLKNPVRRIGPIDNASEHRNSAVVWTVDIKAYFPTTTADSVFRFFRERMQCASDVAALLTKLVTLDGRLPTGAPSSPIIAFYANAPMWEKIHDLCQEEGLEMTLYMDDLTVSGQHVTRHFRHRVKSLIRAHGFVPHKEKLFSRRPAHVTGAVLKSGQIDAPNAHYKKTRLLIAERRRTKDPEEREAQLRSLKGLLQHRRQLRLANKR